MSKSKTIKAQRLCALAKAQHPEWKTAVREALMASHGNVAEASKALGVSTRQVWRWIKENPSLLRGTGHQTNPSKQKDTRLT